MSGITGKRPKTTFKFGPDPGAKTLFGDVPGWNNSSQRADGLRVTWRGGRVWMILPKDGSPAVTDCACCGSPFRSSRAAKLVANAVYPMVPVDE